MRSKVLCGCQEHYSIYSSLSQKYLQYNAYMLRYHRERKKNTVENFITKVYELDPSSQNNKTITEIIWTDGPSSELKNA